MSSDLKKLGINTCITLEEINNTCFDINLIHSKQEIEKQENNVKIVAKSVSEFLKN